MEREYYLENEKVLATHHRALALDLARARGLGDDEIADSLQAALWHLGVAILRTAKASHDALEHDAAFSRLPCVSQNSQLTVEDFLDAPVAPDHRSNLSEGQLVPER